MNDLGLGILGKLGIAPLVLDDFMVFPLGIGKGSTVQISQTAYNTNRATKTLFAWQ